MRIDHNTPVAMLTLGQLKDALREDAPKNVGAQIVDTPKRFVYGITGIAKLFNCSAATASRIKASGRINGAVKQIGRKIVVDADMALQLAGEKQGGRK